MATAHGPCRFGQYAPYLRMTLDELGYGDVMIFSPTSRNGYGGLGEQAPELLRSTWWGIVLADLAQKFLLKTRPYETLPGAADAAFEASVGEFETTLAAPGVPPRRKLRALVQRVEKMRDRFRHVPASYTRGRPLIGLVGEIFCRLNTFSNDDLARRVEQIGGECWISDVAEWIWYTNWYHESVEVRERGRLTRDFVNLKIKTHVQHADERALLAPVAGDLQGYEEPHDIRDVLNLSEPYLPPEGSIGEMVLNVGKSIYLHAHGVDGIIDISPFTCMNGIICEAIYPAVSADHDNLPIRVCYFDGTNRDMSGDLEIFLGLARSYQRRKRHPRSYPAYFE
jgi:predicted nucleotide-binding protein (sugar kinase/HSP70/actin superfamily)